jgi:hypothetical protein
MKHPTHCAPQSFGRTSRRLVTALEHDPILFDDTRLQFLALNSAWEINEYHRYRASINQSALALACSKPMSRSPKPGETDR